MKRMLIVLAVVAACPVLIAGPAAACSCAAMSPRQATAVADVVFTGTATAIDDPGADASGAVSSGRAVRVTFDIDRLVKGELRGEHVVSTAADGASCGAGFVVGERYRVHAEADGDTLTSGLCSGNRLLPAAAPPATDLGSTPAPDAGPLSEGDTAGGGGGLAAPLSAVAVASLVAASAVVAVRHHRRSTDT